MVVGQRNVRQPSYDGSAGDLASVRSERCTSGLIDICGEVRFDHYGTGVIAVYELVISGFDVVWIGLDLTN